MNDKQRVKLSKYVSLILRHNPDAGGITLDSAGWCDITDVVNAAIRKGYSPSAMDVLEVVQTNDKKRFEISGHKIRACQGHSVDVDLGLAPAIPPQFLYHGTATKNIHSICEKGILAGTRKHVHLSVDIETATNVGMRHGSPVIFRINSQNMHKDGVVFFVSNNGVWLTDHVPTAYMEFL